MEKIYLGSTNTLSSCEEIDVYFYYDHTEDKTEYFGRFEFYWKKSWMNYFSLDEFYLPKNEIKEKKLQEMFNGNPTLLAKKRFLEIENTELF